MLRVRAMTHAAVSSEAADYIIVGAGSAGCAVAARLSADPAVTVAIIEAGGDDRPLHNPSMLRSNMMIGIPAGYTFVTGDPRLNWNYTSQPDPSTKGRTFPYPRGKVLGGSSAINGLLYTRGMATDYDGWRQLGCVGWGWEDILPVFRRMEDHEHGAGALHGTGGPLAVSDVRQRHPVIDRLLATCAEAGYPTLDDLNGDRVEGVGYAQLTARRSRRRSAAASYLHAAMRRPNLRVETGGLVTRIVWEGRRAVGVAILRDGEEHVLRARREVIVSAGGINSPKLLQLSGIGPAALLRGHGLPVILDRAAVGADYQDHYMVALRFRVTEAAGSLNAASHGVRLAGQVLRYLFMRRGLLAHGACQMSGLVRTSPDLDLPDAQLYASAATVASGSGVRFGRTQLERLPGFTVAGNFARPQSRGRIRIASADPAAMPLIDPNYLSDPVDQIRTVALVRWIRSIVARARMQEVVTGELPPSHDANTDEEILDFARSFGATAHHPAGTCRMGEDAAAVVDSRLRVRGVEGLRIADTSVMPRLPSSGTNGPAMMIGERAAAMIREDAAVRSSNQAAA